MILFNIEETYYEEISEGVKAGKKAALEHQTYCNPERMEAAHRLHLMFQLGVLAGELNIDIEY